MYNNQMEVRLFSTKDKIQTGQFNIVYNHIGLLFSKRMLYVPKISITSGKMIQDPNQLHISTSQTKKKCLFVSNFGILSVVCRL